MSEQAPAGCPAANELAAFVDGRLRGKAQARLEAHLAACPDCLDLVAEAWHAIEDGGSGASDIEASSTGGWTRRHLVAGVVGVAAAIAAVLIVPDLARRDRGPELADLAVAASLRRPVEGRLSGGFPHAPLIASPAGGQGDAAADQGRLLLAAGEIREQLAARETPDRYHALGVLNAWLGRYDAAALSLAAAAREQPLAARYQSDAAALYLERARLGLRPDDLPRALSAAERARLADSALPEGWFNRSLAFEALGLNERARQSWSEYLVRDASSPWAGEAREHLAALGARTASRWPEVAARLHRGVDAPLADEAATTQLSRSRDVLETTLWPAWANAVDRGDDASREREALRAMAAAMSRAAGDELYVDAVAALDRAEAQGPVAVARLASAHRQYAAAAALYSEDRFGDAAPGLQAARAALAAAGSGFAARVDLDLAAVSYFTGHANDAARALAALGDVARRGHYTYLEARVEWLMGLIAFGEGAYGDARAAWEATLARFEQSGDAEQVAAAHGLLANWHDVMGDSAAAWEERALALRGLTPSTPAGLKHGLLTGAAGQAFKEQQAEAALVLQDEAWQNAREQSRPAMRVDALLQRASILVSLGRVAEANADLASARQELQRLAEPALHDRRESMLLSAESRIMRSIDPARAVTTAERALALSVARNDRSRLAEGHLRLAEALVAAHRPADAERIAAEGMAAFDTERTLLARAGGVPRDDESWRLYGLAMRLALDRGERDRAFALASIARSRGARTPAPGLDPATLLSGLQKNLGAGEAVLALNQLDDELVMWLVGPRSLDVVRRPITRAESARLVARHRDEIDMESARPLASANLADQLLGPFEAKLQAVAHLRVVPDAPFDAVAYAGLWNRTRERFQIEERAVSVASDVSALGAARPLTRAGSVGVRAVLELAPSMTRDAAFASWSAAPDGAILRLNAPVRANRAYPGLSRVVFADSPGRHYSGTVFARDIATHDLSRLAVVVLADCLPSGDGNRGETPLTVADSFLSAGAAAVVAWTRPFDERNRARSLAALDEQLGRESSAAAAVRSVQQAALLQSGRRLGAWTGLVAYDAGR